MFKGLARFLTSFMFPPIIFRPRLLCLTTQTAIDKMLLPIINMAPKYTYQIDLCE